MKLSEDEIKEAMSIQKRLEDKIAAHRKEIGMLERTWKIIDNAVTESSFTSAADMLGETRVGGAATTAAAPPPPPPPAAAAAAERNPPTPIRNNSTGETVANAYKTDDYVNIIMADGSPGLTPDIAPFRSFFLERILNGMQRRDEEDVQSGALPAQSALNYSVETDPETGRITSILIRNYRDERRASELISTAGWSFSRMLEKRAAGG